MVRFLIVDDDESVQLYLQTVLAGQADCTCVQSGDEAVEVFRQAHADGRPFEVVFMDILMPGMDGHQTAEILRAEEQSMEVPQFERFKLVMISSLVDDANVSKAFFQTHASCYIVKPLNKEKVLEELRQNLIL